MSDPDFPKGHADLQELRNVLRRPLKTLYALDRAHDPYLADKPVRFEAAQWFADVYDRLRIRTGIHVRQIFYLLVSQAEPVWLNGKPFENTLECYQDLTQAIRDARYLGLIPANAIIDRRNPEPIINFRGEHDLAAEIQVSAGSVETYEFGINYRAPTLSFGTLTLFPPSIGQRYQLEIWIEKSTANEVLLPLGRRYGINIATFVGEVSATACENLVDRAIASGRPVRIFHITDFDPGGRSMPIAAARKIDFYAQKSGVELDIRLEHVALTPEQCIEYELPRTPIKESERRAANFEAQFGAGATELDALEALHPGVLRQILVEQIERYYDADLDENLEEAVSEAEDTLRQVETEVRDLHADEIATLEDQQRAISATFDRVHGPAQAAYREAVSLAHNAYVAAIEQARDEIAELQQRFVDQAEPLIAGMDAELARARPDGHLLDWPEPDEADEWDDDPLYDSTRSYIEQVDRFREFQGRDSDVRLAVDRIISKTCLAPDCRKVFETTVTQQKFCSKACANRHAKRVRAEGARHAAREKT
jgi:hypothetical protein